MFRDDVSELRALVWDITGRVEKLKRVAGAEETERLLKQVAESLKEAHLGLYFVQVEVGVEPQTVCTVHDDDDPIPERICGRKLPCVEHSVRKAS